MRWGTHGTRGPAKQRAENLQEKLGLSDEQYTKTYEAILGNQTTMREKMGELMANRDREGMRTAMEASRKELDKKLKGIFNEKQWTSYLEWKLENARTPRRRGGGK